MSGVEPDMSPPRPVTARAVAADVLTRANPQKADAAKVLADFLRKTDEPQRTTDLVFGVLKNRCLIDVIIKKTSAVSVKRITPEILNILRVAIYELVFCPLTPPHAIVSQAVETAKALAGRKQVGFVNAVLRKTTRHIENREKSLAAGSTRRIVPQSPFAGCLFDFDLLAEPEKSPADYLADAFSLPLWLVSGWLQTFGFEQTRQVCFASNRRPSIYLQPNILKTTVEKLTEKLQSEDVKCEIVADSDMIRITSPGDINKLPGFDEGLFTVQDLSAAQVVRLLHPQPDWSILDLCAAPGTKTTQLAQVTQGRAKIVATDIDNERLARVRDNITRLGLTNCVKLIEYHTVTECVKQIDGFDCVLVDAPCSNTGVLARRPEVRHRITKKAVENLAGAQMDLLSQALRLLKPKGIICYSTCSIQPQENTLLVERFLAENSPLRLKLEKLTMPSFEGFDHDGGYAAVITNRVENKLTL